MKARHAERVALVVTLVVATLVAELWPQLDLRISAQFYLDGGFVGDHWEPVRWVYRGVPWLGTMGFMVALASSLSVWRCSTSRPPRWHWRRATAMVMVLLLGLGLAVHMALKDGWGRPRPDAVQPFGGPGRFAPALQPSDGCARNCSFVSGHAGAGYALVAMGLFGSRRTRWRWWLAGTATGTGIGLLRVMQGRHFASDILFCLLVMWGSALLLREVWLRWTVWRRYEGIRRQSMRGQALSDEKCERTSTNS